MNEAMLHNAYGDHFLTDAFAAGHLINKEDVMAMFRANVKDPNNPKSNAKRDKLCDAVATEVFKDAGTAAYISRFDGKFVFWWAIDNAGDFSTVLKKIDNKKPGVVANAIALTVHDKLNHSETIEVKSKNHPEPWMLSGDMTLNKTSKQEARKAVAQSQVNVMNAKGIAGPLDLPAMFQKVWDIVPQPTGQGTAAVKQEVDKGTDPTDRQTIEAVAKKIIEARELLMVKAVE